MGGNMNEIEGVLTNEERFIMDGTFDEIKLSLSKHF